MGGIFVSINQAVLIEVVFDLEYKRKEAEWEQRSARFHDSRPSHIKNPEHLPGDISNLDAAIRFDSPPSAANLKELLASLADTSTVHIWKTAAASLLVKQGDNSNVSWHTAKEKALEILELRQDAVGLFTDAMEELSVDHHRGLCEDISTKLRALERFARIYNRQPLPSTREDRPSYEIPYSYAPVPERKQRRLYPAYPQMQQKVLELLLLPIPALTNDSIARLNHDNYGPNLHSPLVLPPNPCMATLSRPPRLDHRP